MKHEYQGKTARQVADLIIAREEAFLSTDYEALSFRDKCRYAAEYTSRFHFTALPDPPKRAKMFNELHHELLRLAEVEDPVALYMLGCRYADLSGTPTEAEGRYLKRSMNAGYFPAALALFDYCSFSCGRPINDESERVVKWLDEHVSSDTPDCELLTYYVIKQDRERCRELAVKMAFDGDRDAIEALSFCKVESECLDFFDTALYLAYEHFYNKGFRHLGDRLGFMMTAGRGCEFDFDKLKDIYVELMMSFPYDRDKLLRFAEAYEIEGVIVPYKSRRRSTTRDVIRRAIMIALLSGDRARVDAACERAREGDLTDVLDRAYRWLIIAGRKRND